MLTFDIWLFSEFRRPIGRSSWINRIIFFTLLIFWFMNHSLWYFGVRLLGHYAVFCSCFLVNLLNALTKMVVIFFLWNICFLKISTVCTFWVWNLVFSIAGGSGVSTELSHEKILHAVTNQNLRLNWRETKLLHREYQQSEGTEYDLIEIWK